MYDAARVVADALEKRRGGAGDCGGREMKRLPYAIQRGETGLYYRRTTGGRAVWMMKLSDATRFASYAAAEALLPQLGGHGETLRVVSTTFAQPELFQAEKFGSAFTAPIIGYTALGRIAEKRGIVPCNGSAYAKEYPMDRGQRKKWSKV
jgi:hypothetical protein